MSNKVVPRTDKQSGLLDDDDYNLWVLLMHTRDTLAAYRKKELSKCGLSAIESIVLFIVQVIEQNGAADPTPSEISRWLFRKPNSISTLVARMEKKGLVRRVNDLDKKNLVRIALTEKGYEAYRQSARRVNIRKSLRVLPAERRQELQSALSVIWEHALKNLGMAQRPPFPYLRERKES
ncbi:MAG: winged helix DNA-binding protein [Chloroflexi bacterium]|nr:winged helix DNA-binding protein [Chloroflexota bacterium]